MNPAYLEALDWAIIKALAIIILAFGALLYLAWFGTKGARIKLEWLSKKGNSVKDTGKLAIRSARRVALKLFPTAMAVLSQNKNGSATMRSLQ